MKALYVVYRQSIIKHSSPCAFFFVPSPSPHPQNYVTGVKLYFNTVWGIPGINSFYWQTQPNTGNNVMRNNIFWAQVCETSRLFSSLSLSPELANELLESTKAPRAHGHYAKAYG